jgi:hypothetical protein
MANEIPLNVSIGTIPPAASGETRQEFAQKIAERLLVYLPAVNSTFVIGGSQPASDEGPWFKEVVNPKSGNNGYELHVWSTDAGSYKPLTLNQTQLRYYIGTATPSQSVYDIWFKVDTDGAPQGIFTYNSNTAAWEVNSYLPSEIDAFFEGETGGGKKQVEWESVLSRPAHTTNAPRALSGALVTADAAYDWEQVYHTQAKQMLIYDPNESEWKTLDGGVGDVKAVKGTALGDPGHFAAGNFATILGCNPGWQLDDKAEGRVIVGAKPTELWDSLTTAKKEGNSQHGNDDFAMTVAQMPEHDHDFDTYVGDGAGPAPGYGSHTLGTGSTTETKGDGDNISLVQKSVAYFIITKVI